MEQFGKLLVLAGAILATVGLLLAFRVKMPFDFHFQRDNFHFYFPIGTSILISVILTLVFSALNRGK